MKFITFVLMFLMFFFVSCDSDTVKTNKTGEKGYPCYNNKTCNGELVCVNDICVDPVSDNDNTDVDVVDETSDSDDIEDTEPIDNDSVEPDLDNNIDDTDIIEEDIDNIDSDVEDTEPIDNDSVEEDIDNIPDEDTVEMYNDCVVPAEGLETTLLNWDCIGGNWWSKEIMKHSVASGRIIQTSTEFLNEIQSDCNNIGGRLSTVTEIRKAMNKTTCLNFSYPEVDGGCKISDNNTDISYYNYGNCDCSVLDKKLTYVILNKSFNVTNYQNNILDVVYRFTVLENTNNVQFDEHTFPYKASGIPEFWYQCVKN